MEDSDPEDVPSLPPLPPSMTSGPDGDGIKTVTSYLRDPQDPTKIIQETRKFRVTIERMRVSKSVLAREEWKQEKFGQCAGKPPGPESNITSRDNQERRIEHDSEETAETKTQDDWTTVAGKKKEVMKTIKPLVKPAGTKPPPSSLAGSVVLSAPKAKSSTTKYIPLHMRRPDLPTHAPPPESPPSTSRARPPFRESAAVVRSGECRGDSRGDSRGDTTGETGGDKPAFKPTGKFFEKLNINQDNQLFIRNLPEDVTSQDIHTLGSKYGRVTNAYAPKDRESGMCRGFAFLSYDTRKEAEKALPQLNGCRFHNVLLEASWAKK
jgi:translation initiation factor 3 subunit G